MIARLVLAILLTAPISAPGGAVAQETPPRDERAGERSAHAASRAAAVQDRVAQLGDTAQLRELEREYVRSGTAFVFAGLTALRLWEVTGERTHARRARGHFDRAASRDVGSAWAHYGHALSLEAEMDRDPGLIVTHINASRDLGLDPVSRARRALERAVALDPSLPGAIELLARYAAETRDEGGLIQARTSFEMSVAARSGTRGLLGIAMTARELGDYSGSAAAARRAVATDPSSAGAYLELAVSLASVRDSIAAAGIAYGTALRLADGALLERMWDDAAMLHTDDDARAWNEAPSGRQRALLRTFWDVRGMLAGLTGDERAAEHYRRVTIARQRFARRGMFGAAPQNALRLEKISSVYDDRGVIYVRHGEPEHTIGEPPLQSYIGWFYTDEGGDPRSYHFQKSAVAGASRDYLLMHNLPCGLDAMSAAYDPRLTPLVRHHCDMMVVRSVSALINRDAERALRTDSHRLAFDAALPFHFDWYTFRANAGTELLMAVGVPLEQLPPGRRSLRMRLSVLDTADMATVHTTRVTDPVARAPEAGRVLRTHLAMGAAPMSGVYRIDVRDAANGGIGTIYGGDITLPDYSGDTLMVSDVMLAEQDDSGAVMRGEARLALAPTQVFRDGEFRVYYEIYNMPAGTSYTTDLTVEPLRRGGIRASIGRLFTGEDGVRLRFADRAAPDAAGIVSELRDITAPFRAGAWLLRVTITTDEGTITRERRFRIEE